MKKMRFVMSVKQTMVMKAMNLCPVSFARLGSTKLVTVGKYTTNSQKDHFYVIDVKNSSMKTSSSAVSSALYRKESSRN